ncbi:hypothetical protein QJS10_CPA08g01191 [Acorus calamus]|uniref:TOD1/MUCI70 glycosyltransferase-like domain-containing protein n=1 Tax=Acorus calamus TaxID=4465 RepID=A0AAV9E9M3_ACOCL|nr:hypothetical protein QJS10_CPA08g01191 [Acorus calamus]
MAQYRQTGTERFATSHVGGGHNMHGSSSGAVASDQIGIRINHHYKRGVGRRSKNQQRRFSARFVVVNLLILVVVSLFAFIYSYGVEDRWGNPNNQYDQVENANGFPWDLNQMNSSGVALEHVILKDDGNGGEQDPLKGTHHYTRLNHQSGGLYNEAGRDELRHYEEEYETSLRNTEENADAMEQNNEVNSDDENDDRIDTQDGQLEGYDPSKHDSKGLSGTIETATDNDRMSANQSNSANQLSNSYISSSESISDKESYGSSWNVNTKGGSDKSGVGKQSGVQRKPKGHRFSSCEMKFLNSTAQLVEPVENHKFTRFSLQYTEAEDRGTEDWVPRFAGHQSWKDREESYYARDQRINCGFIKGPKGSPSTGFDLAEDDVRFMSSCHIAVSSCIFGDSDYLRTPTNKMITRSSKKNVCFVMFMDEDTLQALESEGQKLDGMGFIGLWKIVVVKNLPYTDMRRVGKIPKLLAHRLFPSARYSIWLDSKLRLQKDPLLILEYFLWCGGYEYAISNHYDRHCVWEEVAQNKRLNKYNHTVIDEQFAFYKADGLTRFNASDPQRLLPSRLRKTNHRKIVPSQSRESAKRCLIEADTFRKN